MILHILRAKVPSDEVTVVTSVCNEAIGSVCSKLEPYHAESPMVVLGNPRRLAAAAIRFTIPMQVEADPAVCFCIRYLDALQQTHCMMVALIDEWESRDSRYSWACKYEADHPSAPSDAMYETEWLGLDVSDPMYCSEQYGEYGYDEMDELGYSNVSDSAPTGPAGGGAVPEHLLIRLQCWWAMTMSNTNTSGLQYKQAVEPKIDALASHLRSNYGAQKSRQREVCIHEPPSSAVD